MGRVLIAAPRLLIFCIFLLTEVHRVQKTRNREFGPETASEGTRRVTTQCRRTPTMGGIHISAANSSYPVPYPCPSDDLAVGGVFGARLVSERRCWAFADQLHEDHLPRSAACRGRTKSWLVTVPISAGPVVVGDKRVGPRGLAESLGLDGRNRSRRCSTPCWIYPLVLRGHDDAVNSPTARTTRRGMCRVSVPAGLHRHHVHHSCPGRTWRCCAACLVAGPAWASLWFSTRPATIFMGGTLARAGRRDRRPCR